MENMCKGTRGHATELRFIISESKNWEGRITCLYWFYCRLYSTLQGSGVKLFIGLLLSQHTKAPSNFQAVAGMLFMDDDPVFAVPWRKIKWGEKESDLRYVNDYKPQSEGQRLRILLYGPRGAGKSSFINSVQSALRGRMCMEAVVHNGVDGLSTDKYSTHMMQKGSPKSFYPFVFTDTLGLDQDEGFQVSTGVQVDDIKLALMGHVKEGYKFNPESKLSKESEFYKKSPTDKDKVHVLVCVAPISICMFSERKTLEKIRDIRSEASHLGIPHVVILTKVDVASPETERDIRNIYRSQYLKERMEEFSTKVGFPMNCIFPVKNYHDEIDVSENTDSVILSALKCIINYGDDFLNRSDEWNLHF